MKKIYYVFIGFLILIIIYLTYFLINGERGLISYYKNINELSSENEELYQTAVAEKSKSNEELFDITGAYVPLSKDLKFNTTPLNNQYCSSEKDFEFAVINTKNELRMLNSTIDSWKDVFDISEDRQIILNLIELTLLHEQLEQKINNLYDCKYHAKAKLESKINNPYKNLASNIDELNTNIQNKYSANLNTLVKEILYDKDTNPILIERITKSNFWLSHNKDTNEIWIAAEKILRELNQEQTEICIPCNKIDWGNYYALLIGINEYKHFTNLITPENDVNKLAKILREKYQFKQVKILKGDKTRSNIINTINSYRDFLGENDNLLIYYSGHGQRDTRTETGYWLVNDSHPEQKDNWISSFEISEAILGMEANKILLISDSCYSGLFVDKGVPEYSEEGFEARSKAKARRVITSGRDDLVPDSMGGDPNSLFVDILIQELTNLKEPLFSHDLHSKINKKLSWNKYDQDPQYGHIGMRPNIKFNGHFIFVPREN